jgi:hypothetical protein
MLLIQNIDFSKLLEAHLKDSAWGMMLSKWLSFFLLGWSIEAVYAVVGGSQILNSFWKLIDSVQFLEAFGLFEGIGGSCRELIMNLVYFKNS